MKSDTKRKIIRKIIFLDQENDILRESEITRLPLCEKSILAGSVKFYNDPEPCMIHRGAVMTRFYMEIDLWIDGLQNKSGILPVEAIPGQLLGYLEPWVLKDAVSFKINESLK